MDNSKDFDENADNDKMRPSSTSFRFCFFKKKLGLIFKVSDGKVTFNGMDGRSYPGISATQMISSPEDSSAVPHIERETFSEARTSEDNDVDPSSGIGISNGDSTARAVLLKDQLLLLEEDFDPTHHTRERSLPIASEPMAPSASINRGSPPSLVGMPQVSFLEYAGIAFTADSSNQKDDNHDQDYDSSQYHSSIPMSSSVQKQKKQQSAFESVLDDDDNDHDQYSSAAKHTAAVATGVSSPFEFSSAAESGDQHHMLSPFHSMLTMEPTAAASTMSPLLAADSSGSNNEVKALIESEFFFGHNIKKMVRLSTLPSHKNYQSIIQRVKEAIRSLQQLPNDDQLLLSFYDHDVDEFVLLDDYSVPDFYHQQAANKKGKLLLRLSCLAPPVPPPIPAIMTTTSEEELASSAAMSNDDSGDLLVDESTSDIIVLTPQLPAHPPPPIPAVSPHIPTAIAISSDNHHNKMVVRLKSRRQNQNKQAAEGEGEDGGAVAALLVFLTANNGYSNSYSSTGDSQQHYQVCCWRCISSSQLLSSLPPAGSIVTALNHVSLAGLTREQQMMLLKQRQRPLIIDFLPAVAVADTMAMQQTVTIDIIKPSLFLAKYNSSYANRLRRQIDKLIDDYLICDWSTAYKEGTGLPQRTLLSLYTHIEIEMRKLDLFNSNGNGSSKRRPSRGGGDGFSPFEMTDDHWQQVRNIIESMLYKRVAAFTRSLFFIYHHRNPVNKPGGGEEEGVFYLNSTLDLPPHLSLRPSSSPISSRRGGNSSISRGPEVEISPIEPRHIELSSDHPLSIKLAFLRFATLAVLGLSKAANGTNPSSSTASVEAGAGAEAEAEAEAGRLFLINRQLLQREEWYLAVKGIHQAAAMALADDHSPGEILQRLSEAIEILTRALSAHLTSTSISRSDHILLLLDEKGEKIFVTEEEGSSFVSSDLAALKLDPTIDHSHSIDNSLSVAGDDILPTIIWAVIQANPPAIETMLWICSEFRHGDCRSGQQSFCLASLSSAVEFIKAAVYSHDGQTSCFDLSRSVYDHCLLRYCLSLKLMLACKQGDADAAIYYISLGADVNGLSPDCMDSPLTACIRFNHLPILQYLLTVDTIQVDMMVRLYRGPRERSTALHIAADENRPQMIVALLTAGRGGANRYAMDEDGHTALDIAADHDDEEGGIMQSILLADPDRLDLIEAILAKGERLVLGLLLQSCEVDYLDDDHQLLSPLIAAVLTGQSHIIQCLFSLHPSDRIPDPNLVNTQGESALLVCVQTCLLSPSWTMVGIAAMLVRACADPELIDKNGHSPARLLLASYGSDDKRQQLSVSGGALHHYLQGQNMIIEDDPHLLKSLVLSADEKDKTNEMIVATLKAMLLQLSSQTQPQPQPQPQPTPIYEAARHRDMPVVRALLLTAVHVNAACPHKGYTALIAAVFNQDYAMVKLLIQAGAISQVTDYLSPVYFPIFRDFYVETEEDGRRPENSIENRLDLNRAGRGGMTALHYAAQAGLTNIVGLLLSAGATRHPVNGKGHSPLDVAIANGHVEAANALRFDPAAVSICLAAKHGDWLVIKALLVQGVSINTKRMHNSQRGGGGGGGGHHHELYTPLIAAVAHGQTELVKKMLALSSSSSSGNSEVEVEAVDVNAVNLLGQSALMYAAARGDEVMILLLLRHNANRYLRDNGGGDAAYWAEQQRHDSIVLILRHDPAIGFVHDLIRRGDFDGTIAMLKQGVSVNQVRHSQSPSSTTSSAMMTAVDGNEEASMRRRDSISVTADSINSSSPSSSPPQPSFIMAETPLMIAARYNRLDILTLLLKAPIISIDNTDDEGWTALFHAGYKGHDKIVLKLLKTAAASRVMEDKAGMTAAMIAKQAGHALVAAIIEADPRIVHIHDAAYLGNLLHVAALIEQGCPPAYRDERPGKYQQTPLMAAASGGQREVCRMLLRSPAVIDTKDDQDMLGRTALMRAAAKGALDVTAVLLNAGCDRNIKDKEGLTARDHAARHSFSVMFQFMSQSMVR